MRYLKLLLIILTINSCKGQNDASDILTSWYEVNKQGDNYYIVDCGYSGESFKIQNDSILDHGIMEDSVFKIQHIIKKKNIISLYINDKEKYDISWIDKSRGIIKRVSSLDGSLIKYYVNITNLNKINRVKGTSKDCMSSDDFDIKESNTSQKNNVSNVNLTEDTKFINNYKSSDNIIGLWQLDCSIQNNGIEIYESNNNLVGTLALVPPAIFIDVSIEKGENQNIYYLKYLSQDMDPPMASENKINEKNTSKSENIGKIILENEKLKLTWYGIYNIKTKKRTNTKSQFNDFKNSKFVTLKKCISTTKIN